MMNTRLFTTLCLSALVFAASCSGKTDPQPQPQPTPEPQNDTLAKGADLGWISEMESRGYKFYNEGGGEMECTALMKSIGFNSVRHRVWVNPTEGWCNTDDVVAKCLRAQKLGMRIMIDFHYSDWWADPGKQNVPAAWEGKNVTAMADSVAAHTERVLSALKAAGVDVTWVQPGNEVTNGMLWESGRVQGQDASNFVLYFNSGAKAVKKIYPNAQVILHIDNGWNLETVKWFFSLMGNAQYDIMGFSLYPSYWDDASQSYPAWRDKCTKFINTIVNMHKQYSKPIMLCEFGMPASEPEKCAAALDYLFDSTKDYDWFKGIFYWEPESEKERNGYEYGAFAGGKPTKGLEPFKNY